MKTPWESYPGHPEGNQPWILIGRTRAEAETPILWPPDAKNWLTGQDPEAGKDWRQEKRVTEDEMVGYHHWLNRHEYEQSLGDSGGQGSLACWSPRSRRVGHDLATEQQQTTSLSPLAGDGRAWGWGWKFQCWNLQVVFPGNLPQKNLFSWLSLVNLGNLGLYFQNAF